MPYTVGDVSKLISAKKRNSSGGQQQCSIFDNVPEPEIVDLNPAATVKKNADNAKKGKKEETQTTNQVYIDLTKNDNDDDLILLDKPRKDKKKRNDVNKPRKNRTREDSPGRLARTVFIGNLASCTTKKELVKLLRKHGRLECVRFRCAVPSKPGLPKKAAVIKKTLHPEKSTLSAFAVFSSDIEAQDALRENATLLHGRHIRVDIASGTQKHNNKCSIFIGNLPCASADEEDLWQLFSDCGDIKNVRIIRDQETGLGKGIGYILFEKPESVTLALEKDGTDYKDRPLRVKRCAENAYKNKQQQPMQVKKGPKERKKQQSQGNRKSFKGKFSSKNKGIKNDKKNKKKKLIKKKSLLKKKKSVSEIISAAAS